MTILIVEDEESIREVQKAYLSRSGYTILEAEDGEEALSIFKKNKLDLVLLDLNLPIKNGIDVCKIIRLSSNVPIIMVTAKVEEIDEIVGLEIGADDYIKKPFSPSVLVARVNTLLRRVGDTKIQIKDLIIDPAKMVVEKNDNKIEMTTTQFNILYTLAKNPGRVFTREDILERSYNDTLSRDILDRTIDAHIKSIRKHIELDPKDPKYIITVIGKGYKFNDQI